MEVFYPIRSSQGQVVQVGRIPIDPETKSKKGKSKLLGKAGIVDRAFLLDPARSVPKSEKEVVVVEGFEDAVALCLNAGAKNPASYLVTSSANGFFRCASFLSDFQSATLICDPDPISPNGGNPLPSLREALKLKKKCAKLKIYIPRLGVGVDANEAHRQGKFDAWRQSLSEPTVEELEKAAVEGGSKVRPPPITNRQVGSNLMREPKPVLGIDYLEIQEALGSINWRWPGWIADGFITAVGGRKGVGKSGLTQAILIPSMLSGELFPDGQVGHRGGKLLLAEAEAGQQITVERLLRVGFDPRQVVSPLNDAYQQFNLDDPQHFERFIAAMGDPSVTIGLIDAYSTATRREEGRSGFGQAMHHLAAEILRLRKPLVVIMHLRKPERGPHTNPFQEVTIEDFRGHGGVMQTVRIAAAVDIPDSRDPDHRRLRVIVNNLASPPPPIGFRWVNGVVRFDMTPSEPPQREGELARAMRLLRHFLGGAGKTVPGSEVKIYLYELGISPRTLDRAKSELQVLSQKVGIEWLWSLPEV